MFYFKEIRHSPNVWTFWLPAMDLIALYTVQWYYNTVIFLNILRQRQDGRHFPDNIFKCIFLTENL